MTLQAILRALHDYPEHLRQEWAEWLFENYWLEKPELRFTVFSTIVRKI